LGSGAGVEGGATGAGGSGASSTGGGLLAQDISRKNINPPKKKHAIDDLIFINNSSKIS
jgi:hypothetical protein